MIEKMTKYSFILLSADKEKFLEDLTGLGVVDITRSSKPVDAASASILAEAAGIKKQMAALEAETSDELLKIREELQLERKKYAAALLWGDFSKDAIEDLRSRGLDIHFHQISTKRFNPEWENQVPLQVVSQDKANTYFTTILADGQS